MILKQYGFEEGIHEIYGSAAEIHTFEMMPPKITPPSIVQFHQLKLVGEYPGQNPDNFTSFERSITSIRKELGHVGKVIDIFKIDIEGSEYEVLKGYINEGCPLKVCLFLTNRPT